MRKLLKHNFILFLLVFLIGSSSVRAQSHQCDSVVTVNAYGETEVEYVYPPVPVVYTNNPNVYRKKVSVPIKALDMQTQESSVDIENYPVASIPIQEGVSSTGARTYIVGIGTASGVSLSPNISLSYNSQYGQGNAGYGWQLSGLSTIIVRNRNQFYDSVNAASLYDANNASYSLDGNPILPATTSITGYAYKTSTGNILIRRNNFSSGKTSSFDVLYPNGSKAVYGGISNTSPMSVYPITRLEDRFGNVIKFSYICEHNMYYITRIDYGENAHIDFSYESIQSYCSDAYYAGQNIYQTSELSTIISYDGDNALYKYNLTHKINDGASLLTKIEYEVNGKALSPLNFSYGNGMAVNAPNFVETDFEIFPQYFNKDDSDITYIRGKFILGRSNDGLIMLPKRKNYTVLKKVSGHHKFGSEYSADQDILCYPIIGNSPEVLKAGEGFQQVEAVDVNGDGVDELVKINSRESGGKTLFTVNVYSFNQDGKITLLRAMDFTIDANYSNSRYKCPVRCWYQFGNFAGDGKSRLLVISGSGSRFALVNLESGEKNLETSLFEVSMNRKEDEPELTDDMILSQDFENDGKTDFCRITDSGMDVYTFNGTSFQKRITYSGITKQSLCHTYVGSVEKDALTQIYCADINGDGYLDIAALPRAVVGFKDLNAYSSIWNVATFSGKQFYLSTMDLYEVRGKDAMLYVDVNKDGLPDLLHLHSKGAESRLFYLENTNGRITRNYSYSGLTVDESSDLIPCNISGSTNTCDIIVVTGSFAKVYSFSINRREDRLLTKLTDSFGVEHKNTYTDISAIDYTYRTSDRTYSSDNGYFRYRAPIYVVSNDELVSGDIRYRNDSYIYYDAVFNNRGLGFRGFGEIRKINKISPNTVVITKYDPENMGVPINVSQCLSEDGSGLYSETRNSYSGSTEKYVENMPQLASTIELDYLTGRTARKTIKYDAYGYPISETKITSTVTSMSTLSPKTFETVTANYSYLHKVDASIYILGNLTSEKTIRKNKNGTGTPWAELKETEYTSDTYLPCTIRSYVGENSPTNLISETQYKYDENGHILSEKTASHGSSVYIETVYSYDDAGRYLRSETDALGHTTYYEDYNVFGNPEKIKDYKNRVTSITYDNLGNLYQKLLPDGTIVNMLRNWGGIGLYTIEMHETGKPSNKTHYDIMGNEIRSSQECFDGKWKNIDKEYDSRGHIIRESYPFYEGESWHGEIDYSYDVYGRQTSVTKSSGKETTWEYSGLTTKTTNNGVVSESTIDESGRVSVVKDAGGTITYSYRSDGQPEYIKAPGDIKTIFEYDAYGRRCKIIDPSAGIQTTSVTFNADGSSLKVDVNPNGTIKTYFDKFGRTEKVDRLGEYSTVYTYNTDGLIEKEESTNGTGKSYMYDSLDRLISEKEIIPDGKWLQKDYAYEFGSVLTAIKYTSQSGEIATELYTYSRGYNTQTALPEGQIIWRLESENVFGQPTSGKTGNVTRKYGYSTSGMPKSRSMGDVMSYTYSFDTKTMNLVHRSDEVNRTWERFGYDELDRLANVSGYASSSSLPYEDYTMAYYDNGNLAEVSKVGTFYYENSSKPYQLTSIDLEKESDAPSAIQSISYTCYGRPSRLNENGISASFTYNGDGERVKMLVATGANAVMTKYYMGGQYEYESSHGETYERLYLGGDYYSAPMMYLRKGEDQPWILYNIGRDYLGSITHVADYDGSIKEEYRYDAWGRSCDPMTLSAYPRGMEAMTLTGNRGYTGHEHLPWFGLINMNARLYDPIACRFLSPDPYVQMPDFTQNFNRYSYALNNPLKYTDQSGELFGIDDLIIGAVFAGISNWIMHGADFSWNGAGYFGIGAASIVAGGMVGNAVAPSLGFVSGAISGAASGSIGGFILGSGNSWISGDSFNTGLLHGLNKSLVSAAETSLIQGTIAGLTAISHSGNFWTGRGATFECFGNSGQVKVGQGMKYSNDYAHKFSLENFGSDPVGVNNLYADGRLPNDNHYTKDGITYAKSRNKYLPTNGTCLYLGNKKGSDIYLYKTAFSSKEQLYLTMGHEYLHAAFFQTQYKGGKYDDFYQHEQIYKWSLEQASAWNFNEKYYQLKYTTYRAFAYRNSYSYLNAGFYILPINPF